MALLEWTPIDVRSDPDEPDYRGDPAELIDAAAFLLTLARRPAWHALAACRGEGPDQWFPGQGGDVEAPKAVCATCPVRTECGAAGRAERFGIWGGMSDRQRTRTRRHAA